MRLAYRIHASVTYVGAERAWEVLAADQQATIQRALWLRRATLAH